LIFERADLVRRVRVFVFQVLVVPYSKPDFANLFRQVCRALTVLLRFLSRVSRDYRFWKHGRTFLSLVSYAQQVAYEGVFEPSSRSLCTHQIPEGVSWQRIMDLASVLRRPLLVCSENVQDYHFGQEIIFD
jgi:hypothetical protein